MQESAPARAAASSCVNVSQVFTRSLSNEGNPALWDALSGHSGAEEKLMFPSDSSSSRRSFRFVCRCVLPVVLLLFGFAVLAEAQTQFDFTTEIDCLLRDGLNKMYRYELAEADESFDELVRRF